MNGYTDMKLNDDWQLTQATNGDAPLVSGLDAFLQDVRLEAITQEGELFYDNNYGWSLLDFLHGSDDEVTKLEIQERVKRKLANRDEIDVESIHVEVEFGDENIIIRSYFQLTGEKQTQSVEVSLNRVRVEVIEGD